MSEIVKIVGIKKTLKKDTTDVFYWNIFYEQAFSEYDTESGRLTSRPITAKAT